MANWTTLKASIANIIKTNGNQEITGQLLQNTLNSIINFVGENATFAGIAEPSTNPGTHDGPVFYFANAAGTYSNFDGIKLNSPGLIILYNLSDKWQSLKVYECLQTRGSSQLYPMSQQAITSIIKLLEDNINLLNYDFEDVKDNILNIESDLNTKIEAEDFDSTVESLEANLLTDALRKTPQVLSESEQQTARANIGAQGALRTSADLALRDDVLSLTDMAKKRLFIDLWNECAVDFGRYNEETGYFELNGLTDLTYDDAVFIYTISANSFYPDYKNTGFRYDLFKPPYRPLKGRFRTNLPCNYGIDQFYGSENLRRVSVYCCNQIEVLNVNAKNPFNRPPYYSRYPKVLTRELDFYFCGALRKVMGYISLAALGATNFGYDLPNLEEINLYNITQNYKYFYRAPKLNYSSVKCMIENRGGTDAITIWYHANVYNKILGTADDAAYEGSGGTKEEWMALADLAASKNITLATA